MPNLLPKTPSAANGGVPADEDADAALGQHSNNHNNNNDDDDSKRESRDGCERTWAFCFVSRRFHGMAWYDAGGGWWVEGVGPYIHTLALRLCVGVGVGGCMYTGTCLHVYP